MTAHSPLNTVNASTQAVWLGQLDHSHVAISVFGLTVELNRLRYMQQPYLVKHTCMSTRRKFEEVQRASWLDLPWRNTRVLTKGLSMQRWILNELRHSLIGVSSIFTTQSGNQFKEMTISATRIFSSQPELGSSTMV